MIHLHRHSDYSLLDGAGTSFQFAELAAKFGQGALAQTDHGTIAGLLLHIKACEENGIMPICGVEAYYRPNRHVQQKTPWRYARWHLILLAQNLTGWHNLLRITSESYADGFYDKPCVDLELLYRYREGLICSSACIQGPLAWLIRNGNDQQVDRFVQYMQRIFGDRFFIEIHPHDFADQRMVNIANVSIANKYGIAYYAAGDAHYPYANWMMTQKIITLIATNSTVDEWAKKNSDRVARGEEAYEIAHEGLHLMEDNEMRMRFRAFHPDLSEIVIDEAIENTDYVASLIEPFKLDSSLKMPHVTETISEAERIISGWCQEGLEKIGKWGDPIYMKQMDYELSVIKEKQLFPYMVLVGRLVRWCKSDEPFPGATERKDSMRVGSGRGSAAGSLVSYLCSITTIDPIAYKLKFERFLNPERKNMPDVDIDIESERRDEAKLCLAYEYGEKSVADLVSYSRFQPRYALQSVAKTLYGYESDAFKLLAGQRGKKDGITEKIDQVHDSNLLELRDKIDGLDDYANKFPDVWLHATRLENSGDPLAVRLSKHAGGIVITPGDITNYVGTLRASENEVGTRTAWPETPRMSICDDFGVLKLDLLSLKGLTQQHMIISSIHERTGELIDLDTLPALVDPYSVESEVMEYFQTATLGVNQFEEVGIANFLKQLKPENIVDLSAANALYRPGPMGSGGPWSYAKRKNGEEAFSIPEPLIPVLGDTYGVLAFQEQVMDTFSVLAEYSPGQADDVRKIIAKLYRLKGTEARKELEVHKQRFMEGAVPKIGEVDAGRIWSEILPYSGYSFNRAHAGGYAVMAYQDMWLKVHYPFDFYAAILSLEPDKAPQIVREARKFGVSLVSPDINLSGLGFTVDFDESVLRYGLIGIRGVSDETIKYLLKMRPFASLEDFVNRTSVKYSKCNKARRDALIKCGALDAMGGRDGWSKEDRAQAELHYLGFAVNGGAVLGEDEELLVKETYTEQEIDDMPDGSRVVIAGVITNLKTTTVKKGRQAGHEMCFMTVGFGLDQFRTTCFPDVYRTNHSFINGTEPIIIEGRKDNRGGIIVNAMMSAKDFIAQLRETQNAS